MGSTTKDGRSMANASLFLFGPQLPHISQKHLSDLRESLLGNSKLQFLVSAITELPSLWPTLIEAIPKLSEIPGESHLHSLNSWLDTGIFPDSISKYSIILAPLTVITHVVEFLSLNRKADVQGFCIGFLSAVAVACAHESDDFERLASTALRLALCVGAVVDLDEATAKDSLGGSSCYSVHWKTDLEKDQFEKKLSAYPDAYISCVTDKDRVTVTIPLLKADLFASELRNSGVSIQPISLDGQFHLPTRIDIVHQLKALCKRDKRFQFPTPEALNSPLRSNIDAKIITEGELHDIALDSILTYRSEWFQTVDASITAIGMENIDILPIGGKGFVPRSLTTTKRVNSTSFIPEQKIKNEVPPIAGLETGPEIAVVGMGCRFPKANSVEEFWDLINSGGCAVGPVPKNRFDLSELWREPKRPFWGNFLDDPDTFDHRFFRISSREAKSMDPQQRLLLQVAYEAMESAGFQSPSQSDVGCYIGVGSVDYEANVASEHATAYSATGTLRAFISGKISHYFGWSGPSITFDTACSSSAVAIHSACKALGMNECSMAIAGGVNVITNPTLYQNLAAASFLSPTGASKAFDADANGYCRGEGAGVVVLKLLSRAIADHDDILGVIKGTAVNQGSNCTPITVPHSDSQSALYRQVLSLGNVDAKEVTYVEAHGTGTPVGDPIECESIRKTIGGPNRSQDLYIGSVKDNIGHAEAASGVAGLLKALLMIQHRTIPKQANFVSLNPKIPPLAKDRMKIAVQSEPWISSRMTVIVNNYGAAGSNAALLLQEQSSVDMKDTKEKLASIDLSQQEVPFFLAARTPESLKAYCAALDLFVARTQDVNNLVDIAYNLAKKQNRELPYSYSFVASNKEALRSQLKAAATGVVDFKKAPEHSLPVILCFGGQTGRTVCLSDDIFKSSTLLQTHLVQCDSVCIGLGLPSLFPRIFDKAPVDDLIHLHCMLFSLQYSSAKSWLDSGLQVDTLLGHSFGQLTALCVSGCVSLEDGIRVISERARLVQEHWYEDTGIMLSIEGDRQVVEDLLDSTREQNPSSCPDVACYNGPRNIVIAGTTASIEAIENDLLQERLSTRPKLARLANSHAYHSKLAGSIMPGLRKVLNSVRFKTPLLRVETCSAGQSWAHIDAEKVARHTREPVYFSDAVERVASRVKSGLWLEAGSASPIIAMARRVLKVGSNAQHTFAPLDLSGTNTQNNLANVSCTLWEAGFKSGFWPFKRFSNSRPYRWMNLPPYQFEKTRHWIQLDLNPGIEKSVAIKLAVKQRELLQLLLNKNGSDQASFSVDPTNEFFSLGVRGHAVLGQSLCPASMYCELVLRAVRILAGAASSDKVPRIWKLSMDSPVGPTPAEGLFVTLSGGVGDMWSFEIFTGTSQDESARTAHASGMVALLDPGSVASALQSLKQLVANARCDEIMHSPDSNGLSGSSVYKLFGRVVDYADYYRGVKKVFAKNSEVAGNVSIPENQPSKLIPGCCNPVAIDNFLQVAGIHVNCLSECADNEVFVCTLIGGLSLSERFAKKSAGKRDWIVYSNFERASKTQVTNNIFVVDPDSRDVVVTITGVQFTAVPLKSLTRALSKLNGFPQVSTVSRPTKIGTISNLNETYYKNINAIISQGTPRVQKKPATSVANRAMSAGPLKIVQDMLGDLLGIPCEEIRPASSLVDLGIDSLMVTEVSGEIKKRFNISISTSDLLDLKDVQSLCLLLPDETNSTTQNDFSLGEAAITSPNSSQDDPNQLLESIQEMLSEVLGTSTDEIQPTSFLADLGVDSLMITEVASEVKKRFEVSLSTAEFQDLTDVQSLCQLLLPSFSMSTQASTPQSSPSQSTRTNSGASPGYRETSLIKADEGLAYISQEGLARIRSTYDSVAANTGLTDFYTLVYPAQAQLVVAYLVEAFTALGCPLAELSDGQRLPAVPHSSKHRKAINQYYKILEDAELITSKAQGFYRTKKPADQTPAHELQSALVDKFPKHASEHKLLHTTAHKLADCLTEKVDPLSLLFRDAEARRLLEDVYTNAPMFKAGTLFLAQYLDSIFRQFTENREIRILELGGGTGGTTKFLIDQLVTSKQTFEYTFTDLSPSLVAAAKKKFAKHNFMKYAVMDIEQSPPTHLLGCYDIIISTNCIHATRDLRRSCSHIKSLLRETGILCLVELTRNLFWFDLVFGLLEGWWLFDDGREHALADETLWEECILSAGFQWVDWTEDESEESSILRVIAASPTKATLPAHAHRTNDISTGTVKSLSTQETVIIKQEGDIQLYADIYYPKDRNDANRKRPVALMIHGGGHIMLSRKDIRPKQTQTLLDAGFLPVSIDYRLCPEINLLEGPMQDVCDALKWIKNTLSGLQLQRHDIQADCDKVVVIGWSTGGHLALTLGWTASAAGIPPPLAILAFYCPTDYEDPFWSLPNIPRGSESAAKEIETNLWEGVYDKPITAYNVPANTKSLGGWMAPSDPRSRIALHMNWKGQALPVLLHGSNLARQKSESNHEITIPTVQEIQSISPLAQIRQHKYKTPTFLIHGTSDDLIPWQQTQRTYEALVDEGVDAEVRIVSDAVHLFDIYPAYRDDVVALAAVRDGYRFLCERAGLSADF